MKDKTTDTAAQIAALTAAVAAQGEQLAALMARLSVSMPSTPTQGAKAAPAHTAIPANAMPHLTPAGRDAYNADMAQLAEKAKRKRVLRDSIHARMAIDPNYLVPVRETPNDTDGI